MPTTKFQSFKKSSLPELMNLKLKNTFDSEDSDDDGQDLEQFLCDEPQSSCSEFEVQFPHQILQNQKKRDQKAIRKQTKQNEMGHKKQTREIAKEYLSDEDEEYSFSPIMATDRKVAINFTDISKLGHVLDTSKDVPLKKPQSAYVLFGNEQRIVIAQKYKGLKVTEVVKMIAKEWQKLTKVQRQKYKDAAKRDKERFSQELAKLSGVDDQTLLYQMPKRPLTAYMFFVRQTRVRIAKEMNEIAPLDIMKEVGKEWQRCSQKDLAKLKLMAKQDEIRYQQEMEQFIRHINKLRLQTPLNDQKTSISQDQTPTGNSSCQQVNFTANKDEGAGGASTANITPVKVQSPSNKVLRPKKPLSAYIFYSQEQRDLLKKENPHLSTRDVMNQVSKQWSLLKKFERQQYAQMAGEDKRRFENQMSELRLGINNQNQTGYLKSQTFNTLAERPENQNQFDCVNDKVSQDQELQIQNPQITDQISSNQNFFKRDYSIFDNIQTEKSFYQKSAGLNLLSFQQNLKENQNQWFEDEIQELSPLLMNQRSKPSLFTFD